MIDHPSDYEEGAPPPFPASPATFAVAIAIIVALMLLALGTIIWTGSPVRAAEQHELGDIGYGHSAGHEDYSKWMRPDAPSSSCCNDSDCRPTKARHDGRQWWAVIDRVWTPIPEGKVLPEPSQDGIAHICASASPNPVIYCFRPPGGQT